MPTTFRIAAGDFFKALTVGSGTLLLGAIGFWLSPLKGVVAHRVWTERPTFVVSLDSKRVTAGDDLNVDVVISPGSPLDIAEGVLSIECSPQLSISSTRQIKTPAVVAPITLGSPTFSLTAVAPGHGRLTVTLRTRYGTYSTVRDVIVEGRSGTSRPSPVDFSGIWNIAFGGLIGDMQIRESAGQLEGTYRVRGGFEEGFVEGIRDGTVFRAVLIRKGNSPYRWTVTSNWSRAGAKIEIKGTAALQEFANGQLVARSAAIDFYAAPRG